MDIDESINVLDEPLEPCSDKPLTGFFRDGKCNTSDQDVGSHTVCVRLTAEWMKADPSRLQLYAAPSAP